MAECDCDTLLGGKLRQGRVDVVPDVTGLHARHEWRPRIRWLCDVVKGHLAGTPKTVEAEVERDAVQPRAEAGCRLPAGRVGPETEEGFLRHILGARAVAERTSGKGDNMPEVSLEKPAEGFTIARSDPEHEHLIRVLQGTSVESVARPMRQAPGGTCLAHGGECEVGVARLAVESAQSKGRSYHGPHGG